MIKSLDKNWRKQLFARNWDEPDVDARTVVMVEPAVRRFQQACCQGSRLDHFHRTTAQDLRLSQP